MYIVACQEARKAILKVKMKVQLWKFWTKNVTKSTLIKFMAFWETFSPPPRLNIWTFQLWRKWSNSFFPTLIKHLDISIVKKMKQQFYKLRWKEEMIVTQWLGNFQILFWDLWYQLFNPQFHLSEFHFTDRLRKKCVSKGIFLTGRKQSQISSIFIKCGSQK